MRLGEDTSARGVVCPICSDRDCFCHHSTLAATGAAHPLLLTVFLRTALLQGETRRSGRPEQSRGRCVTAPYPLLGVCIHSPLDRPPPLLFPPLFLL